MTLEERITRLEDIEAIRQLQSKYQRCLDTRDFDGIAECFADNVVSAYGNGSMSYNGKDEVLAFLRKVMTEHIPSTHLIHGGEIEVFPNDQTPNSPISQTTKRPNDQTPNLPNAQTPNLPNDQTTNPPISQSTAHAKWYLEDYLNHRIFLLKLHGAAIYDVDYVKQNDRWQITKIGYTRCYEYFAFRGILNILTLGKTTFLDNYKKKKKKQ